MQSVFLLMIAARCSTTPPSCFLGFISTFFLYFIGVMYYSTHNTYDEGQILNKIQAGMRKKRIEHISFLESNNFEFPPINNIAVNFPISNKEKTKAAHSIHTPTSRKIQMELEHILEENNIKLSRSNINQIIIASPLKTKLVLDSAHRSKVLPEGGQTPRRSSYQSFSKVKFYLKEKEPISKSLLIKRLDKDQYQNKQGWINLTPVTFSFTKSNHQKSAQLKVNSLLDKLTPKRLQYQVRTMKQHPQVEKTKLAPCSPWADPENDQQLAL